MDIKCKVCPVECNLKIIEDKSNKDGYIVKGNKCNRGREYALKEILEPSRVLTSRVLLKDGPMGRVPVKTNGVISSELVDQAMEIIRNTTVRAPLKKGDIIIKNLLDTGVDLIAARKVNKSNRLEHRS